MKFHVYRQHLSSVPCEAEHFLAVCTGPRGATAALRRILQRFSRGREVAEAWYSHRWNHDCELTLFRSELFVRWR